MSQPSTEHARVYALRRKLRLILWMGLGVLLLLIVVGAVLSWRVPAWQTPVLAVCVIGICFDLLCMIVSIIYYEEVRKSWNILRARDRHT